MQQNAFFSADDSNAIIFYDKTEGEFDGGYLQYDGEDNLTGNFYTSETVINNASVNIEIDLDSNDNLVTVALGNNYDIPDGNIIQNGDIVLSNYHYTGSCEENFDGEWNLKIDPNGYVHGAVTDSGNGLEFNGGYYNGYVIVTGQTNDEKDFIMFGEISESGDTSLQVFVENNSTTASPISGTIGTGTGTGGTGSGQSGSSTSFSDSAENGHKSSCFIADLISN
ncbi:MAG: hypothetical protein GY874_12330 [Desulfobacteraceae bacterium]|nr:hypothetical protein [Desulfobacteraceae bacterium]